VLDFTLNGLHSECDDEPQDATDDSERTEKAFQPDKRDARIH